MAPVLRDDGIEVLRVDQWRALGWLVQGFSTRIGGVTTAYGGSDLNLGFTAADQRERVERNRELFVDAVTEGSKPRPRLVTIRQVHSATVETVGLQALERHAPAEEAAVSCGTGDGMISAETGVLLGVLTADCIPVLVADTRQRVVGAFHAGWRGTVRRIVERGVGRMRAEFGSRAMDLTAAIGPGIGACCYAVGEEVREEFTSQFAYASQLFRETYEPDPILNKYPKMFMSLRAPGHSAQGVKLYLGLAEANRRQLVDAGVRESEVFSLGLCTMCDLHRFFSHRAEQGHTGRLMAVIGVSPPLP